MFIAEKKGEYTLYIKIQTDWSQEMLENYLKVAIRNIKRHKIYAFINIGGLVVGMVCCILIFLYIKCEFSFDTFHVKADRLYRVIKQNPGYIYFGTDFSADTPYPLAQAMVDEFPEVMNGTRFENCINRMITYGEKRFIESGIFADEQFFNMFTFLLIAGDKKSALRDPYSMVITNELAEKLFGKEDPIGKSLNMNEQYDVKITGVLEDPPENSHFRFNFILSINTWAAIPGNENRLTNWRNNQVYTFIELQEGYPYAELEKKLPVIIQKNFEKDYVDQDKVRYYLQPIKSIHLHSHINGEFTSNSDIKYIYILASIGLIILIVACINSINLMTVLSTKRAKEIGIRKVVGAFRRTLVFQFLGEFLLPAVMALVIALFLVELVLPSFNSLVERSIGLFTHQNFALLMFLLGLVFFVGGAGFSPALFLSKFQPAKALKGTFISGHKGSSKKAALSIVQFGISIALIVCTVVVHNQLHYIKKRKVGYSRENIIAFGIKTRHFQPIKTELLQNKDIIAVCGSNYLPTRIGTQIETRYREKNRQTAKMLTYIANIGYDFMDLYEIELKLGRKFSREFGTDAKEAVILNEAAVKTLGWKDPIGKKISYRNIEDATVIGVVKDFHFQSLHHRIQPLMLLLRESPHLISVKINPQNIPKTILFLKKAYEKFNPNYPFNYYYVDDLFNSFYESEQKLEVYFRLFFAIAILLSCMGLFGLVFYSIEKRTKEIGIRKVLGLSTAGIVRLISMGFFKYVLAANIIAWPIAYYFMNKWLQNFAYRINIGIEIFIISAVLTLLVALLAVSYPSIKAATANPVDSLRYE
ncbi:MAG: ABC transporter permease [Thermoplasmata archaeon]|nr:MAG: ABC transporter permease [Thermoplasmata archaeon]